MSPLTQKTLIAAALIGAAAAAHAEGWQFLPVLNDPSYVAEPSLAVTVDRVNPRPAGAPSATALGIELNMNCVLLQDPDKRLRTSLKLHRSSEDGTKATTFELSPRYMLPIAAGLSAGAGPSLTAVRVSSGGDSRSLWGAGVALALDWRSGPFFAGADLRWHDLRQKDGVDYDNTALGLRVGINF